MYVYCLYFSYRTVFDLDNFLPCLVCSVFHWFLSISFILPFKFNWIEFISINFPTSLVEHLGHFQWFFAFDTPA